MGEEGKSLKKDNRIVLAKYNLTGLENKIYHYVLRELQIKISTLKIKYKENGLDENEVDNILKNQILTCEISRYEINNLTNSNKQKELKFQKKTLDGLKNKTIILQDFDSKGNENWISANFFSAVGYNELNNMFYIRLDPLIYISIIKNFSNGNFTLLDLNNLFKLKNYYSQRLYELLKKWKYRSCQYSIDDLKEYMLGADFNKKYANTTDFKRKVLEPSIKELVEKGLYKEGLTYSQKKKGVKVTDIIFENVIDNTLNIKINNKDLRKLNSIKDKYRLSNNKKVIESKDITIKLLESLNEISYSIIIKYLVCRCDLVGESLYIATLDFKSDNYINTKIFYVVEVIKELFKVNQIYLCKSFERDNDNDLIDISEYESIYSAEEKQEEKIVENEDEFYKDDEDELEEKEKVSVLDDELVKTIKNALSYEMDKFTHGELIINIQKIIIHYEEKVIDIYSSSEKEFNDFESKRIKEMLIKFDIIENKNFELKKFKI